MHKWQHFWRWLNVFSDSSDPRDDGLQGACYGDVVALACGREELGRPKLLHRSERRLWSASATRMAEGCAL